eukprot:COSAG02_NODE_16007_length_1121_cov_2.075342_1_plen_106_part_00
MAAADVADDLRAVMVGLGGAVVLLYGGRVCRGVCASVPGVGGRNTVLLRGVPDNPERTLATHLQLALDLTQMPTVRFASSNLLLAGQCYACLTERVPAMYARSRN